MRGEKLVSLVVNYLAIIHDDDSAGSHNTATIGRTDFFFRKTWLVQHSLLSCFCLSCDHIWRVFAKEIFLPCTMYMRKIPLFLHIAHPNYAHTNFLLLFVANMYIYHILQIWTATMTTTSCLVVTSINVQPWALWLPSTTACRTLSTIFLRMQCYTNGCFLPLNLGERHPSTGDKGMCAPHLPFSWHISKRYCHYTNLPFFCHCL